MRYGAAAIEISRFTTEVRPHVRALVLLRSFGAGILLRAVREGVVLRHVERRRRRDGELWLRRRFQREDGRCIHRRPLIGYSGLLWTLAALAATAALLAWRAEQTAVRTNTATT